VTGDIKTNNLVKIIFVKFGNIWQDVKKCRTMGDRLRFILGGLSWRPSYFSADADHKTGPRT
jgi:hypothetical protein